MHRTTCLPTSHLHNKSTPTKVSKCVECPRGPIVLSFSMSICGWFACMRRWKAWTYLGHHHISSLWRISSHSSKTKKTQRITTGTASKQYADIYRLKWKGQSSNLFELVQSFPIQSAPPTNRPFPFFHIISTWTTNIIFANTAHQ